MSTILRAMGSIFLSSSYFMRGVLYNQLFVEFYEISADGIYVYYTDPHGHSGPKT